MASGTSEVIQSINKLAKSYGNSDNVIDTMLDGSAFVICSSTINSSLYTALGDSYAYVIQVFYNTISSTSNRIQIAFSYHATNSKSAWRNYYSGSWSSWHLITS